MHNTYKGHGEDEMTKLEKVGDKAAYENLLIKYAELENKIADIKANCDLAIEGRDVKIKELTDRLEDLQEQNSEMFNTIALQEQQIEKMKCCANCSKYDRYNRVCSRTKFSIIETLCNCSDDWELRR